MTENQALTENAFHANSFFFLKQYFSCSSTDFVKATNPHLQLTAIPSQRLYNQIIMINQPSQTEMQTKAPNNPAKAAQTKGAEQTAIGEKKSRLK